VVKQVSQGTLTASEHRHSTVARGRNYPMSHRSGVIYADGGTVHLMAEVDVIRLRASFLGPRVNLSEARS
jgi:hypothetical protein